jgi:hypothetical protein
VYEYPSIRQKGLDECEVQKYSFQKLLRRKDAMDEQDIQIRPDTCQL